MIVLVNLEVLLLFFDFKKLFKIGIKEEICLKIGGFVYRDDFIFRVIE